MDFESWKWHHLAFSESEAIAQSIIEYLVLKTLLVLLDPGRPEANEEKEVEVTSKMTAREVRAGCLREEAETPRISTTSLFKQKIINTMTLNNSEKMYYCYYNMCFKKQESESIQ